MTYISTVMMAAFPALLLGLAATNQALAWEGDWGNGLGWIGEGGHHWWGVGDYQQSYPGPGAYENGYNAGISDAIYDHTNNLVYNPVGQCLSCHSQVYWNGFHKGYDAQWNTYQSINQGTSINIYGNHNYVNTAQNSGQSSGPVSPSPLQEQNSCNGFGCGSEGGGGSIDPYTHP